MTRDMTHAMTDRVPGLSEEQVDRLVAEAESGYDVTQDVEPNPHRLLVPADLSDAIARRAARDGESPEDVVRLALVAYLDIA